MNWATQASPFSSFLKLRVFHEQGSCSHRGKQSNQSKILSLRILLVTVDRKLDLNWLKQNHTNKSRGRNPLADRTEQFKGSSGPDLVCSRGPRHVAFGFIFLGHFALHPWLHNNRGGSGQPDTGSEYFGWPGDDKRSVLVPPQWESPGSLCLGCPSQVLSPEPNIRAWKRGYAQWLQYIRVCPWGWVGSQPHIHPMEAYTVCQINSAFRCHYRAHSLLRGGRQ